MHFLSRAYINIIYVDSLVYCAKKGNSENFQFSSVRPHIEYSVQIYNKKLNCANAQQLFCTKTKKNSILFRYLRNYDYFCHDIRNRMQII